MSRKTHKFPVSAQLFLSLLVGLLACPHVAAQQTQPATPANQLAASPSGTPIKAGRLLVQRIEAVGVDVKLARSVEEALVLDIGRRQGLTVVTAAEMEQTVKFTKTKAELGCNAIQACVVEVRKKLDVDALISGKLGKLGPELLLTLSTLNAHTMAVSRRVNVQAKSFADIKAQLNGAVDQLLGKAPPRQAFRLPPGSKLKLAVMPLAARGVPAATADAMTQILSSELNQIQGVRVISQDDIKAMLDKVALEARAGCTDNIQCIVEIGASLGLSKLVTGSVGKVKDTFVISGRLIDTRRAEVQNRVLEAFAGDPDELKHATKLVAYQLVGVPYERRQGGVDFTFNVKEGEIRLGGEKGKVVKSHFKRAELRPGRYSLRVVADPDSYFPLQTDVYVSPSATNVRTLTVVKKPTPWYKTWWFWTTIGVVVAGGTALTVYFVTRGDTPLGSGTVTIGGGQ